MLRSRALLLVVAEYGSSGLAIVAMCCFAIASVAWRYNAVPREALNTFFVCLEIAADRSFVQNGLSSVLAKANAYWSSDAATWEPG